MKLDSKQGTIYSWAMALLLIFTLSCKHTISQENEIGESARSLGVQQQKLNWPKPDSFVGEIPVYDKFDTLEPLFRFDNDTTYVINFWATWCKPCIQELPYFEELHKINAQKKVAVVLVSLDFPEQLQSALVPFVLKKGLASKVVVLLDGKYNSWIDKVSQEWSGAIPATYIYRGTKSHLVGQPFANMEELNTAIQPFL